MHRLAQQRALAIPASRKTAEAQQTKFEAVAYITDVEGNLQYLESILANNDVLRFADKDKTKLHLRDNCAFVFGGDCFDKVRNKYVSWLASMVSNQSHLTDDG
jgi:hypothetical protein